jgi:imidazolonepropionase-like amidohydrolase
LIRRTNVPLLTSLLVLLSILVSLSPDKAQSAASQNVALVNGKWFNGKSFETRTLYAVKGRFTAKQPARVDRTLDLSGTWIVPPFGEAHNHNIGTGIQNRDTEAVRKYLTDGVFYVKIQGNLPLTDAMKHRLSINRPDSIEVIFAQGSLTSAGGHPITLVERLLLQGYYPGHTRESLKDYRYFTIDSGAELDQKWPLVLNNHPDFIKAFLWSSNEFDKRKNNPAYLGQYGLDPRLLPKIVAKAHANQLSVSAHVSNAADFHIAVSAGVDEISHLPILALTPIALEDVRLAARRGIAVITTCAIVPRLPAVILPKSELPRVLTTQLANLKLLRENGVALAIGSDNVSDSSWNEVEYLHGLGAFDNLTLLKLWTETTPRVIFPKRKIGLLRESYEASFLALAGNPIEDLRNLHKIKLRFKQGVLLEP